MDGSEDSGKVTSDYYARAIGLAVGELITKTVSEASEELPSRVDHPIHGPIKTVYGSSSTYYVGDALYNALGKVTDYILKTCKGL